MGAVLVLAADEDDALAYVLGHPEIRPHRVTLVWPANLEPAKSDRFDRLIVTAGVESHCRFGLVRAACQTRIGEPAVIV